MVKVHNPMTPLGLGLYTPKQAAFLARVTTQTVTRWVHGTDRGQPAIRAQLDGDDQRRITFLDFVQIMAIRSIRRERKVPLAKIREFVLRAENEYGLTHPFAREHTTYLFEDDIVLSHNNKLIQITGKYKHQDLIKPVLELYMEDLTFQNDLAVSYKPLRDGERFVLVDPHKRMGQPLVMPCGYSVHAILESLRAEGTPQAAAEVNDISIQDVRLAQRYEDILAGIAA